MPKLIQELKEEHVFIAETLSKLKDFGISSQERLEIMIAAKRSLLEHLKKEDEQLYPALNRLAESDADLNRTLEVFAKDMNAISKAVLVFFEKYSAGGSGTEFAKDFGWIIAKLSKRLISEEEVICTRYIEQKA